jgi:hypothetical protein
LLPVTAFAAPKNWSDKVLGGWLLFIQTI